MSRQLVKSQFILVHELMRKEREVSAETRVHLGLPNVTMNSVPSGRASSTARSSDLGSYSVDGAPGKNRRNVW